MTLTLRPVQRAHLAALFKLKVRPDQDKLVAPVEITLAQAAYEPCSEVWGLWDGDTLVGQMAMIDLARSPHTEACDEPESAYVWRLLIDAGFQGRGYGKAALALADDIARGWGRRRISLSVVDAPNSALPFYVSCGYRDTGRTDDGEKVLIKDL